MWGYASMTWFRIRSLALFFIECILVGEIDHNISSLSNPVLDKVY